MVFSSAFYMDGQQERKCTKDEVAVSGMDQVQLYEGLIQ